LHYNRPRARVDSSILTFFLFTVSVSNPALLVNESAAQTSDLDASLHAIDLIRTVCADQAQEVMPFLNESVPAADLEQILRSFLRRILLDDRLLPWFKQVKLTAIERSPSISAVSFEIYRC
jgi:hypothetical protein